MVGETRILTFVAAVIVGAPGVGALSHVRVIDGGEAVGTRMERAVRFAALGCLARVSVTHSSRGVSDRNVTAGAAHGVAAKSSAAAVAVAVRCRYLLRGAKLPIREGLFEG